MKTGSFRGGYKFSNFIGQPQNKLITLEIPRKVIIPLSQGFGTIASPLVNVGQSVSFGQIIARDDTGLSSPVHSSVNGKVVSIEKRNYFKRETTMVIIEADGVDTCQKIEGYSLDWQKLSSEKIEELIYKAGVSALDKQGIPTRFKSSVIAAQEVENLIIHGVSSEAYNISLDILLEGKNLSNFVEAIKILKRIMPQVNIHLVLNRDKKQLIEKIKKLTANLDNLSIYNLTAKYPQGYDEVLVPALLGKKFPYGYSAANIGVIVLNIQALLHIYEAVAEGKSLTERIIALCGPCFRENIHVKARIGTPLAEIVKDRLKDAPTRIVLNSLLTGVELNDMSLPIDKIFSQIIAIPEARERKFLAFAKPGFNSDSYTNSFAAKWTSANKLLDTNQHGEERPCISCGFCEEVCPVQIIPHLLSKYIKGGIIDETLTNYNIFNCIECGLCSYVCPSKIPLLKHMKEGHDKLTIQGCTRGQCILPYFDLKGIGEYRGVTKL